MRMEIIPQLRIAMEQRPELKLAQVIELTNMLAVPDPVFEVVANAITFNPNKVEEFLIERRKTEGERKHLDTGKKTQALYASLVPSGVKKIRQTGTIVSPALGELEKVLGSYEATVTPDVTFIGRKQGKPEIVFSDYLRSQRMLMLLLDPSKYPETSRLLIQLRKFDEWRKGVLREAYVEIGNKQRDYFEDFDLSKLNLFKQSDLGEQVNLSTSTICRVLTNRWVEARNLAGEQKFLYAKDLFVTVDELMRYQALKSINALLKEEFDKKTAHSDEHIARSANMNRRTFTKYRNSLNVPNSRSRDREYKSGEKTESYIFVVGL